MIETVGKFIVFQFSYVRKESIETVSLYDAQKEGDFYYVSFSTKQMCFTEKFETKEAQMKYAGEIIALLNE